MIADNQPISDIFLFPYNLKIYSMENLTIMTEKDFSQLMNKIDIMEKKIDALLNGGVGTKQLYTISDACELLQVSKRTLQKYRDDGKLSFSQVGDKIYFKQTDIDTFLNGNRFEAFSKKGGRYAN